MELDAALATLKAATASVVDALRGADLAELSREQLVSVAEVAHRTSNSMAGTQTVAIAHLAAVEDTVDQHGAWVEQHRGLGHVSLDAPGLIAPVLGLSAQAASTLVDLAVHQVSRTPRLVGAMLDGDLDPWRARVVTTEVEIIPKDTDRDAAGSASDREPGQDAADAAEAAAGDAEFGTEDVEDAAADLVDDLFGHYEDRGRGWHETAGPLRGRVRRMVARAHPDLIEKEAAEARESRGLRRSPATVGTDHWAADLPIEVSLPMWQAVEALARELKNADPSLKIDQARADALAQLVLQQADITIHLHGTVPDDSPTADDAPRDVPAARPAAQESAGCATTSDAGASRGQMTEVGGLGSTQPTLLDLERLASTRGVRVMPSTSLTCHPETGAVIRGAVPASLAKLARKDAARRSDKYVVPADMARLVRLRDGRCRFPNCMTPASKTDQDHVIAWPVGETTPTNLMCLCRRHHRVKQRRGWQARLDPDGTVHWIDPTGRATTTYPINHLDRIDHISGPVPAPPTNAEPLRGEGSRASTGQSDTDPNVTFREIVRAHLRELDEVPTLFEDHLWRRLELTRRGSTLGQPGFHHDAHEMTPPWSHLRGGTTLQFVGQVHDVDCRRAHDGTANGDDGASDDPPF